MSKFKLTITCHLPVEIFVPIEGYEGYYEISNYGTVRSKDRIVLRGTDRIPFNGQIIKPFVCHYKYLSVNLRKNGNSKTYKVHRLVANEFLPSPEDASYEIDHIDADPTNNNVENLRWVSHKINCNNPNSRIRKS